MQTDKTKAVNTTRSFLFKDKTSLALRAKEKNKGGTSLIISDLGNAFFNGGDHENI